MIYFAIDAVLALFGIFFRNVPRANRRLFFIALLLLFLFDAFRFEVGCDWSGYLNQFNLEVLHLSLDIEIDQREPLWWMLLAAVHKAGLRYFWINVVAALGLFAGITALAVRQPDRLNFLALSFPVFLINVGFTQIRQGLAIGILCFAFIAFEKRKPVMYILLTLLAASIHSSALAFLLLVPFIPGEVSLRNVLISTLLALPGLYFMLSSSLAEEAAQQYVIADPDAAGAIFRSILVLGTALFFFYFLKRKWSKLYPSDIKLVYLSAWLMLLPVPLALYSSVIGDRLAYYLMPFQAMIFARARYLLPRSNWVLIAAHAALALFLLVWIKYSTHFQLCYTPYQSWLLSMPNSIRYIY